MTDVIDTTNRFFVASRGDNLLFIKPPLGEFSKEDALNMAAYLVLLAEEDDGEFSTVLECIKYA